MADPRREIELVTPEKASEYRATIDQSKKPYRPLREYYAQALAHDMAGGNWRYNGIPWCFDRRGHMIDGQHRARATELFGKPVLFAIERGLEDGAEMTIDIGRARSPADHFKMAGYGYGGPMSVAARHVYCFEKWQTFRPSSYVTRFDRLQSIRDHEELIKFVVHYSSQRYALRVSASALAAVHYLLRKYGPKTKADEFMTAFVTGEDLQKDDPRLTLRNHVIKRPIIAVSRGGYGGGNWSITIMNQMLMMWNHWRAGDKIRTIVDVDETPAISK